MIIKSMSRASMSFRQLIDYLEKDDILDKRTWNMYSDKNNIKELTKEFMSNSEYIKNSRGKIFLYHEVLSLEKNSLSIQRQREILFSLANEYIRQRADKHLVYGVIHGDTKNLHMHLLISSNKVYANKRIRLSKNQFASIQLNLQNYKNKFFTELNITQHYKKRKDASKLNQKEQEIKYQRHKQPIREQIKENLHNILKKATSLEYLHNSMKLNGYEFYTRGKIIGVKYKNKNYRLKTLDMESYYQKTIIRIKQIKSREKKRSDFKNRNTKTFTSKRDFGRSDNFSSTKNSNYTFSSKWQKRYLEKNIKLKIEK